MAIDYDSNDIRIIFMPEIGIIKKEYEEILQQLSDPELIYNWPASASASAKATADKKATAGKEKFEELLKRKKFLEQVIDKEKKIEEIKNKIKENQSIISAKEDSELVVLAEGELTQLIEKQKFLEKELKELLKGEGQALPNFSGKNLGGQAIIIEIRAGTGGEEAALFAVDIFRMYSKYAKTQGWNQRILDSRTSESGGYKEIIFELKNGNLYSKMKYEGGVHRVQRIPTTEKLGRIHTSTATVAVLPKPKKTEIKIRPDELKIDFYRASGPGGQYVNKRETAVRITHLPTGLVVTSQTERNQLQNKENALSILEARVLEKKRMEEEEKIAGKRKTQVGWAKRAEKIRTYNFPQDRVTDHRIKKSWHHLEKILDGDLEKIISALKKS